MLQGSPEGWRAATLRRVPTRDVGALAGTERSPAAPDGYYRLPSTLRPMTQGRRTARNAIREEPLLVAATLLSTAGFVAYGLAIGSRLTPTYAVTIAALFLAVAAIHARTPLSRPVLWALLAWGIAHLAAGTIEIGDGQVLYNQRLMFPPYQVDRLVHMFGFGTATLVCWEVLRARVPTVTMSKAIAVLVALAGLGVGATNESLEFLATRIAETNVGGYDNTGWDLIANTFGCVAVTIALYIRR